MSSYAKTMIVWWVCTLSTAALLVCFTLFAPTGPTTVQAQELSSRWIAWQDSIEEPVLFMHRKTGACFLAVATNVLQVSDAVCEAEVAGR